MNQVKTQELFEGKSYVVKPAYGKEGGVIPIF